MGYYFSALQNYTGFTGRARRKEYWMFCLCNALFAMVATVVDSLITVSSGSSFTWISLLYSLAVFVPSLAVFTRRMHDIGKSGWWYFIGLIPLVGWVIILVWLVTDGDPCTNIYGPDPKGRG